MNVMLPRDSSGFVRRECPDCQRQFKTRPAPSDGQTLQLRLTEGGWGSPSEEIRLLGLRHCPYCGASAPEDDWLTASHRAYLEELSQALSAEIVYRQMSLAASQLSPGHAPTFVPVPPRPAPALFSRDLDDLSVFYLVCCSEEVKLLQGWRGAVYCFRCAAVHDLALTPPAPELPLSIE